MNTFLDYWPWPQIKCRTLSRAVHTCKHSAIIFREFENWQRELPALLFQFSIEHVSGRCPCWPCNRECCSCECFWRIFIIQLSHTSIQTIEQVQALPLPLRGKWYSRAMAAMGKGNGTMPHGTMHTAHAIPRLPLCVCVFLRRTQIFGPWTDNTVGD